VRDANWCDVRAQVADVIAHCDPDPSRRAEAAAVAYDLRRVAHDLRALEQFEESIDNPDWSVTAYEGCGQIMVVLVPTPESHGEQPPEPPTTGPFP
jgi:predicted dehydrogenase